MFGVLVTGKWVDPIEKNDFEVINPCNEDPCAIISLGSKKDTDNAVKAAKTAFETWKETSKTERLELLEKLLVVYKKRFGEMAEAISLEMGAPMNWATDVQTGSGQAHLEDFILKDIDKNKLYSFLREMEFNRLLSSAISAYGEPDFNGEKKDVQIKEKKVEIDKKNYFLITEHSKIDAWIKEAEEIGEVAVDTETNSLDPVGTQIRILGLAKAFFLCTFLIKCLIISSVTTKSAITPSFKGRIAEILPGVLPNIVFASSPTAKTDFLPPSSITATTDGSFKTTPCSLRTTSVLAVPKSIAISCDHNDDNPVKPLNIFPFLFLCAH